MIRTSIKIGRQIFIVILILFFLVSIVSAVNYPELKDFVTDNANIIDSTYETRITELAKKN